MLHAIAGEAAQLLVVHQHRDVHRHLAVGRAQHLAHALVETEHVGGGVEVGFRAALGCPGNLRCVRQLCPGQLGSDKGLPFTTGTF